MSYGNWHETARVHGRNWTLTLYRAVPGILGCYVVLRARPLSMAEMMA